MKPTAQTLRMSVAQLLPDHDLPRAGNFLNNRVACENNQPTLSLVPESSAFDTAEHHHAAVAVRSSLDESKSMLMRCAVFGT